MHTKASTFFREKLLILVLRISFNHRCALRQGHFRLSTERSAFLRGSSQTGLYAPNVVPLCTLKAPTLCMASPLFSQRAQGDDAANSGPLGRRYRTNYARARTPKGDALTVADNAENPFSADCVISRVQDAFLSRFDGAIPVRI